jgi:hypothetical protein
MTDSWAVFAELDMAMTMTQMTEMGTVEFLCKNGERRSFVGVYFIPRLTVNIVSVGQLDEARFDIHVKTGKMDIHGPDGRLLARIERKQSRLYMLDVNIARRATCLSAWAEAVARARSGWACQHACAEEHGESRLGERPSSNRAGERAL